MYQSGLLRRKSSKHILKINSNYNIIKNELNHESYLLRACNLAVPAIESSHAVAYGIKLTKTMGKGSLLINLSGRSDKDTDYIIEKYGI